MSSDLILQSEYDPYSDFIFAPNLNYSEWDGRQINWRDSPQIRSEIEQRILDIYDSGNHVLAYQLVTLYFQQVRPQYEVQLAKSSKSYLSDSGVFPIQHLIECQNRILEEQRIALAAVGSIDPVPPLEPISETNYPALWAYCVYCQENGIALSPPKFHSGGWKEFWKEHKKAIIIATVVIVVAVTVTVVIVTTAGTGTSIAVATGTAAAQAAIDGYKASEDSDPHASQVSQEVQNFAKKIGATEVSNTNGSIPIIKTDTIPKVTPEVLTSLVNDWNVNLAPSPHSFHPPIDPAKLYGVENVARWYKQFGLEYAPPSPQTVDLLPRAAAPIPVPQETRPSPSSQEFVRFIESKLAEARDPRYKDQFSRPSYPQEFVKMIESKLAETQDREKYRKELWETQHDFMTATQAIEAFFNRTKPSIPVDYSHNNYASTFAFNKPSAPIAEIPLLGYPHQRTIHYHCGIKNNYGSVVEGGLCLNNTLNNQFAIQPHLIHSNNILSGLSLVQIEQYDDLSKDIAAAGLVLPHFLKRTDTEIPWTETALQNSDVYQSIQYEVEHLSQIAQKIIQTGNSNLKQVHVTFSNGGYVFREALEQLTPEERATIIVVTAGTTALIDDDLACDVHNIVGDKDWPSITSIGGAKGIDAAKDRASIDFIDQYETAPVIQGHYFIQPQYQLRISEILLNELKPYEIY